METIHEYNYQVKGFKKFVFDYLIEGSTHERTCKEFAKTANAAKNKVRKFYPGRKIKFTHVYEC